MKTPAESAIWHLDDEGNAVDIEAGRGDEDYYRNI